MKIQILAIILLFSSVLTWGQSTETVTATDTLVLSNPVFKKTLRFDSYQASIFIDYTVYKKSFDKFWNRYRSKAKDYLKDESKGGAVNIYWIKVWYFLDSMHTVFANQVKLSDTIIINESTFDKMGIGPGHDFDTQIDIGQCTIVDSKRNRQDTIIRQKSSYQKGMLDGWGGRKYYFLNSKNAFYSATDWVS